MTSNSNQKWNSLRRELPFLRPWHVCKSRASLPSSAQLDFTVNIRNTWLCRNPWCNSKPTHMLRALRGSPGCRVEWIQPDCPCYLYPLHPFAVSLLVLPWVSCWIIHEASCRQLYVTQAQWAYGHNEDTPTPPLPHESVMRKQTLDVWIISGVNTLPKCLRLYFDVRSRPPLLKWLFLKIVPRLPPSFSPVM